MTLGGLLQTLWRRKWLFVLILLIVPIAAFAQSREQPATYEASSEVLLSYRDLAGALTGTDTSSGVFQDPERISETQATLARVPAVAELVIAARPEFGLTAEDVLGMSDVMSSASSDLLTFSVTDTDPIRASVLATEYGRQFTAYRQQLDTSAVTAARKDVESRLRDLQAAGQADGPLSQSLRDKQESLRTFEALQTSNAFLVRPAGTAAKIGPRIVRNTFFGIAFGLVLACSFVFLVDVLDTRCRSVEEVSSQAGLTLLGRLPEPPRRLRAESMPVMFFEPNSPDADAFRTLRTNIEFAGIGRSLRSVLVTSALEGEGKTTTAVNLALSFARAGHSVALVDLDLRRPRVARFFVDAVPDWVDLGHQPGITDVMIERATLGEAILSVPLSAKGPRIIDGQVDANLDVLVAGVVPPNPGEFATSDRVNEIISQLTESHDIVVIDTPPVLPVSDAIALSRYVDGVVLVLRLDLVRRQHLREAMRAFAGSPARLLGFAATGDASRVGHYGGYGGDTGPKKPGGLRQRISTSANRERA